MRQRPNSELPPVVGGWYRRVDRPQPFQVVAFDPEARTVDIEYFDGTVDEWPSEHWYSLELEPCAAPQDCSGAFDDIEPDELSPNDGNLPIGEAPGSLESLLDQAEKSAPDLEVD
ncbi:MAG: hypothetical protein P4L83_14945 [Nevskia sp.]|nr:hypothetical protein [Nevskia sp.]